MGIHILGMLGANDRKAVVPGGLRRPQVKPRAFVVRVQIDRVELDVGIAQARANGIWWNMSNAALASRKIDRVELVVGNAQARANGIFRLRSPARPRCHSRSQLLCGRDLMRELADLDATVPG